LPQEFEFRYQVLKDAIKASGIKLEQIALDLDVTKEAVVAYLSGRAKPPVERLLVLCQILNLSVEDVFVPVDHVAQVAVRSGRRSRRDQGLPEKVTDGATLDEVAELLSRQA
jgi:transcriptional regulator with XRE-family HTH domain